MIAIIDYDAGNVKSVEKAFRKLGEDAVITRDPQVILTADHVVLPGVGNFGDAAERLRSEHMDQVIRQAVDKKIPFLGICVGMQLLFEGSEESPGVKGLGILPGFCRKFQEKPGCKVPQIGWNSIHLMNDGKLFKDIPSGSYVYFVHSYYVESADISKVTAVCEYTSIFHASVQGDLLYATQFHPEKSGEIGLRILRNFVRIKGEGKLC